MRRSSILSLLCLISFAAPAAADGPFEPNEMPGEAQGPLVGGALTAAFETPQDVDWFVFYAHHHRQIGVLLTLNGACSSSSGRITATVFDGDLASYSASLGALVVGRDIFTGEERAASQVALTSQAGHRYYVKIVQSRCEGTPYVLDVAPAANLTQTLEDTAECSAAKADYRRQTKRWYTLRARYRSARGTRRRVLRAQVAIQRQTATVAASTAQTACTRHEVSGYPFT
jgi:hypothetical protein